MQKSKSRLSLASLIPSARAITSTARKVGFLLRKPRKIQPRSLVLAVLISICETTPHLRGIAENLSSFSKSSPSRQAVFRWLRKATAPTFFMAVLKLVLDDQTKRVSERYGGLRKWRKEAGDLFGRVLVEDGSVIPLHKSLAKVFEGSGNQHGKTASLRMRWVFDLLSGETIDAALHHGLDNDMSTANDILSQLRPRDLLIRDMGYFCLDCLHQIAKAGAFYLTRIPAGTTVFDEDGTEIDIYETIRNAGDEAVDIVAKVGRKAPVTGRFVAVRICPKKGAERRRRLKTQCREEGKTASAKDLFMCDWVAVFTNVTESDVKTSDIATLYRARWIIEVFFKGVKSGQGMGAWAGHRTNEHTAESFCYAHMIIGVLSINLWRVMGVLVNCSGAGEDEGSQATASPGDKAQSPRTIGILKATESLVPFFADVFRGLHTPRSAQEELARLATYAVQEKRNRKPIDLLLLDIIA